MKILVTGFEPFGGESVNPSWMAVERLPDTLNGAEIVKRRLPVVYFRALDILEKEIETLRPDVVVMTGQAGGSDAMRIERVGINLCEAKLPDNDGVQLMGAPIVPEGPNAYFSTFPYREMLAAVEEAGIPVRHSFSAGAYLCNHVLYGALHLAETKFPGLRAGFIHVPFLPEQTEGKPAGTPSLPLEDIARALRLMVEAIVRQG